MHKDGTKTPMYNSLQSGRTRATPATDEEKQLAKALISAKIRATKIAQNHGQLNWVESAGILALADLLEGLGCTVSLERVLDCMIVDICATFGSCVAPVQVKVARGMPGAQAYFHVTDADGSSGGRYEDHILICMVIETEAESEEDSKKFDYLPSTRVMELYIMKSSDVMANFDPMIFDHTTGSKRGRKSGYEEFRYVVGHHGPDKLQQLIQNLESYIHEIHDKRHWTRDDCFFKFGYGSPNTAVGVTKETEIRGIEAVRNTLVPFEVRAPLRPNEATDIIFWHNGRSVRVSQKTATYRLDKEKTTYGGFQFLRKKAPNVHHCDVVIAIQFDFADNKKVVAAYVFDAAYVYDTDHKSFSWSKYAHEDNKFDLTSNVGRMEFKDYVESFMKTDEEHAEKEAA